MMVQLGKSLSLGLKPGESRPDMKVTVEGTSVAYACLMSSSFGVFTMRITRGGCLDVVLKKDDGWSPAVIENIVKYMTNLQQFSAHIMVEGYLERVRAKHVQDTSPICVHPRVVRLQRTSSDNNSSDTGEFEWKLPTLGTHLASNMMPSQDAVAMETGLSAGRDVESQTDHGRGSKTSGTRGAKDDTRFSKFVAFLIETFGGYETLAAKPVLDVAGGAGGLAFELSVRHAIECFVVDVKPLKFKSRQVRHVKFRKECVDRLRAQPDINQSPLAQNLVRRFQVHCDLKTLQLNQLQTLLESERILEADKEIQKSRKNDFASEQLRAILLERRCSLLCGMHPDQATDQIIDIGLSLNIPWAVVPCCIFPSLFQARRTSTGSVVRSYEDYCDYIRSKAPSIREVDLPFRGRNKAFYWKPVE